MRKNIRRIFVSFVAAATIFTSTVPALANEITINMPNSIYETIEKKNISSGVVYEKIMRFTNAGWWNINVLRINLLDPYTEVKGIFNPGAVGSRDKISSLVEKNNAIAGINADFFYSGKFTGPIGALIDKGDLINIPRDDAMEKLPGFFIDFLNQAKIDNFNRTMVATNILTGNKVSINAVNNVTGYFDAVTLLNKHWGEKSIGNTYNPDLIEIFVDDGIVIDKRIGTTAIEIPVDGYVLIGNGQRGQALLNFNIGDKVDLNISSTPDINNIKFSIGGGNIILDNGKFVSLDAASAGDPKGSHPRSGIGISKDGTEIILVTIDGRDTSFKGVSQEMFGAILKELGAYNGINLDGGGSTTMAIKPLDESKATVVNKPSDGAERSVINGVGVFSNAPEGELSYINISTDDNSMFVNTSRKFTVKGYDQYHNPVVLDESKLVFIHEGVSGDMVGNVFKASSQGKAKVTVSYDGLLSSTDINVLGPVKVITANQSKIYIDINSEVKLPLFLGKDANGYEAKLYPEDILFNVMNEIGSIVGDTFHSGETTKAGVLTARAGDGIENILVYVGNDGKLIEGFESINNVKFSSYPNTVTGDISLNDEFKEGKTSIKLKYDFSIGDYTKAAYVNLMNGEKPGLPIEGIPKKLGLWVNGDNSGSWIRSAIKDSKGATHLVDFTKTIDWTGWQYLTTNIPTNVSYPISIENIYIVETDTIKKHSGEVLFDGLTAFYQPSLGNVVLPTPSSLVDNKNIIENIAKDGFSFAVAAEPVGLNQLTKYDASSKIVDRINKHKASVFLNGLSEEFSKGLKNEIKINAKSSYTKTKIGDTVFLNVNTEKKGIRPTDAAQWNKLILDLESITENNIILLLSSPVFGSNGFADPLEADLLHKHLVKASENSKNIFVVHGGVSNTSSLKDSIRYIGLNTKTVTQPEDIYDLSIIEFVVNGSNVTYQISSLFEKPTVKVGQK